MAERFLLAHAVIPGDPVPWKRPPPELMNTARLRNWCHHVIRSMPSGKAANSWLAKKENRPPKIPRRNDPKHDAWMHGAAMILRNARRQRDPFDGPCILTVVVVFKRPQRLCRKKDPDGLLPHDRRPDADNVGKIVSDAIEHAGLITDDARICDVDVRKRYAERGGTARVEVWLETFYPWAPPGLLARMQ